MRLHKHHPRNNEGRSRWLSRTPVSHPEGPRKGDHWFVQTATRYFGENFTVTRVNGRSFYVYWSGMETNSGKTLRRLVVEWEQWIDELFEMGFVYFNGTPVLPPARLIPRGKLVAIDDDRQRRIDEAMLGARRLLEGECVGEPVHHGKEHRFMVVPNTGQVASVTVPEDERKDIVCSCADHEAGNRDSGVPCMHIFAVLISRDELKYRILEFLL